MTQNSSTSPAQCFISFIADCFFGSYPCAPLTCHIPVRILHIFILPNSVYASFPSDEGFSGALADAIFGTMASAAAIGTAFTILIKELLMLSLSRTGIALGDLYFPLLILIRKVDDFKIDAHATKELQSRMELSMLIVSKDENLIVRS